MWFPSITISFRLGQFSMKCKVVGIFGEKLVNIHFYIIWICWIQKSCLPSWILTFRSRVTKNKMATKIKVFFSILCYLHRNYELHKHCNIHKPSYTDFLSPYVWYRVSGKVTLNIIYNFELYITHWKLMSYTLFFSTLWAWLIMTINIAWLYHNYYIYTHITVLYRKQ